MNAHDNSESETEETFSIHVEQPASTQQNSVCLWLRRIFTLNDVPNQKRHRPVFIIVMCILHIFIHLLTYIDINWRDKNSALILLDLFMFFVPCMRPTPDHIRTLIVACNPSMENTTCYYDDELKKICFSFMYPHQLWRFVTVNLLHISLVHLLSGLLRQLLYGILLEHKYGSVRLAVIYWLSDLGASLCSMLANRNQCK
jgi:membrane associated rhomboid family serine protease